MVGDSANDRSAAIAAGFAFVFAAYGYAPADDPALTDAFAVIERFADLRELLCPQGTGK
jgi:phosphoglycolate phosphatase-like HAD superfamily hydrolase